MWLSDDSVSALPLLLSQSVTVTAGWHCVRVWVCRARQRHLTHQQHSLAVAKTRPALHQQSAHCKILQKNQPWFSEVCSRKSLRKSICKTLLNYKLRKLVKYCKTLRNHICELCESLRKPAKSYLQNLQQQKLAKPEYFSESIFVKACKNTCV